MRRLPCFANSQTSGLSMARKSSVLVLGILAAYSVGYIFEVVMAALRYMGLSPHTPKKEEGRPFGPPFSIAQHQRIC